MCGRRGCRRTDFELLISIGGSEAASSVAETRSAACEWLGLGLGFGFGLGLGLRLRLRLRLGLRLGYGYG